MSISASAVLSLQTRINNERSRRGLSSVGFTGGVTSGSNIRAPHINELRSYTETLNTMGSVSFGWSGNVAAGANITDALSQISSYCTTLENEALASWKVINPLVNNNNYTYPVPSSAWGVGSFRWKVVNINYTGWQAYFVRSDGSNSYTGNATNIWGRWELATGGRSFPFTQWYDPLGSLNVVQTPFYENEKAGLTYQPQNANQAPGQIHCWNNGYDKYHATPNYWYYNVKSFDGGMSAAMVISSEATNTGARNIATDVVVEAYY